jgi:hypothetical protein
LTTPSPVKYIAVLRAGKGRVLTVSDATVRRTLEHETKVHRSVVVGEYTKLETAERAAELAERGWRPARQEAS